MKNGADSLLEQLHDIEGLDPIGAWPLAMGWWVVIGLGIALLSGAAWYAIQWVIFRRSWKYDALKKLNRLLKQLQNPSLDEAAIRSAAVLFSEYLRRIALRRFSRSECAGLTGQAWLEWLSKHDPEEFDWVNQGKALLHAPYARTNPGLAAEALQALIRAAKEWVG